MLFHLVPKTEFIIDNILGNSAHRSQVEFCEDFSLRDIPNFDLAS